MCGAATAGTCWAARSTREPNWKPAPPRQTCWPGSIRPAAPATASDRAGGDTGGYDAPADDAAASRRRPPVDVVVPVHGGAGHTLACLDSVLAGLRRPSRLIVVDDASPEPELVAALDALAAAAAHHADPPPAQPWASPPAPMPACALPPGRDVVLLNSDTLVAPGWLKELRDVAYSAPDIGTVTPLSNDATILSYPDPAGGNAVPDLARRPRASTRWRDGRTAATCDRHPGRRRLLHVYPARLPGCGRPVARRPVRPGLRRGERFLPARAPSGLAARRRDRACSSRMSAGSRSARRRGHLRARNAALLERLHPGYDAADPGARRGRSAGGGAAAPGSGALARRAAARQRRGGPDHPCDGGGVERQIAASVERHRADGSPRHRAASGPLARWRTMRRGRRRHRGWLPQPALRRCRTNCRTLLRLLDARAPARRSNCITWSAITRRCSS